MGQKVNPVGLRLGINKTWHSRWYAKKDYADKLHEDLKIRAYLKDKLNAAGIAPTARAEEIGLEQFCALARILAPRRAG